MRGYVEVGINDILNSLITDRTQADVDYALSLQNNSVHTDADLRGAYNISDRNRVGNAINWLVDAMNMLGLHAKDNWTLYDIARVADNANTIECLSRLRILLPINWATGVPADMDKLSYQKANDIERVLYEVGSAFRFIVPLYTGDGYITDFGTIDNQLIDDNWNFNFTMN